MIRQVDTALLRLGTYRRGDLVVIVAGSPPHTVGSTNLIHVHRVGEDDFTKGWTLPPGAGADGWLRRG